MPRPSFAFVSDVDRAAEDLIEIARTDWVEDEKQLNFLLAVA